MEAGESAAAAALAFFLLRPGQLPGEPVPGYGLQVEGGEKIMRSTDPVVGVPRLLPDSRLRLVESRTFPSGVVLLTGTGVVPDADFTVRPGDTIEIRCPQLGMLTNRVVAVGHSSIDMDDG